MESLDELFSKVNTFIFDVDGVLTNGRITFLHDGGHSRELNLKDSYALQHAVKLGYKICIITGGSAEVLKESMARLGIYDVYLRASHKIEVFEEFCITYDIDPNNCLYMGDDIPDFEVMSRVALPCCPSNAVEEIQSISKYTSPKVGGDGCARDVIEKSLRLQGKWFDPNKNDDFKKYTW